MSKIGEICTNLGEKGKFTRSRQKPGQIHAIEKWIDFHAFTQPKMPIHAFTQTAGGAFKGWEKYQNQKGFKFFLYFSPHYKLLLEYTGYFKHRDRINQFELFDDDVLVCGNMKSGTNWFERIVWTLRNDIQLKENKNRTITLLE